MIPQGSRSAPADETNQDSMEACRGSAPSGADEGALEGDLASANQAVEDLKPSFEQLWPVVAIVSERTEDYLIKWEGVDNDGEPHKPTWEKKHKVTPDLIEEWRNGGRRQWKRDKKEKKRLSKLEKAKAKAAAAVQGPSTSKKGAPGRKTRAGLMDAPAPSVKPKSRKLRVRSDSDEDALVPPSAPEASTSNLRKRKSVSNLVEQPDRQRVKIGAVPAIQVVLPTSERGGSVGSSGGRASPVAEGRSIIPDSQAPEMDEEEAAASPVHGSGSSPRAATPPPPPSADPTPPAPSSDVEIVVNTRPLARTASSSSNSSSRPLGAVPIPRPTAFARVSFVGQTSAPASSQNDPIEDCDSSPPRRPLGPSASRQSNAAPAPTLFKALTPRFVTVVKPVRPQLELYEETGTSPPPLDAGDGTDGDEENVPSSSEGSYFSQPVAVGPGKARPIQQARGPFSLTSSGGALGGGGRRGEPAGPAAISIPLAKLPFFRPPSPSLDADDPFGGGGVAVAIARPIEAPVMTSQAASQPQSTQSDFYDQTLPRLDPAQLHEMMGQYESQMQGAAGAGASDAGEAGEGGRANGSAPSSNSQQQSQQQQRSQDQPSRSSTTNGHGSSAGGGGASGPSFYGGYSNSFPYSAPYVAGYGGYPPQGPPLQASAPKRELEGDSADDSSKKARTTSQRPAADAEAERRPSAPAAPMYYHSPSFPAYPSYQQPPPGYPFPPPLPSAQYSQRPQSTYPPMPAYSPPAPQPTTHQTISPSLARVLGPMTGGPGPNPLPSPQLHAPATPNIIAPSPTTTTPVALPPAPTSGGLSPRRQRSQSPVAVIKSPSLARAATFAGSAAVSRNASPAPGGGSNLDGLINLVIASPHIVESDNTKTEIVRFLRDPKAYLSRPDQPLNRSAHWAFELRRMTHEGVEKTDFIILHSETGTHQLKRVARAQAQFDFARSLSHATSRPSGATRGSTPVAETGPTPPAAVSSMTREQLETELEALRDSSRAQLEELTTLRPLTAEVVKLRTDIEKLTKQNKSLANSKEAAQNDFAYMQAQYTTASNAAVARAREAQVAEEETTKLRGMLDVGLKQRDLVAKSESKRLKLEIARLKTEVSLSKAKDRRIAASGVLEKASKWDDMVAKEKYDNQMYDDRVQAMLDDEEEAEREQEREEAEERERERLERAKEVAQELALVRERELANGAVVDVKTEHFACEWRVHKESQVEPCGAIVDSREALQSHLLSHLPGAEPALAELP